MVLADLPSAYKWFSVEAGASLSLQGPIEIQGTTNIAVWCPTAGGKLYATNVTFSGFASAPLAIHGGTAHLDACTFTDNTAPGLSVYFYGEWHPSC